MPEFISTLRPGEKVYGELNFGLLLQQDLPPGQGRGLEPRNWRSHPLGKAWRGADRFPQNLIIPRNEWDQRIEEMEKTETRLSDLIIQIGLECKDQNGTNYCWINAPTHCCEIMLIKQNQLDEHGKPIVLSPASVGAKIKNFRNQGGWGQEGLDYIIEHGIVPANLWPPNAISREFDTAAAWEIAKRYKVTEWWDLSPDSFDEKMSCHFLRIPTADGYNWWSHEVTGYDPVKVGPSKYASRERNSWSMSYGDRGFFVLEERKATPDDCCCPRVLLAA